MATRLIHSNIPTTLSDLSIEEIRDCLMEAGLSEDLYATQGDEVEIALAEGVISITSIHSRFKREGKGSEYAMRTLTLTQRGEGWVEEVTWGSASEEDYKRLTF